MNKTSHSGNVKPLFSKQAPIKEEQQGGAPRFANKRRGLADDVCIFTNEGTVCTVWLNHFILLLSLFASKYKQAHETYQYIFEDGIVVESNCNHADVAQSSNCLP